MTRADRPNLYPGFNPRARMGRDDLADRCEAAIMRFNPRARMGRDGLPLPHDIRITRFNPRARMGRDGIC